MGTTAPVKGVWCKWRPTTVTVAEQNSRDVELSGHLLDGCIWSAGRLFGLLD